MSSGLFPEPPEYHGAVSSAGAVRDGVRELEAGDFEALYEYACALGRDAGFLSLREEPTAAQELRFLAGRVDEMAAGLRVSLVWVGEAGEIAGLAEVRREDHPLKRARMGWLALSVAPGRRGRGIGTSLLEATVASARDRLRLDILLLHVWGQNHPAQRLYRGHGFEECGRKPRVIEHPTAGLVDEITMMLRL
jgi:ribosomal protein S18 acetylase RimI-like enzyme